MRGLVLVAALVGACGGGGGKAAAPRVFEGAPAERCESPSFLDGDAVWRVCGRELVRFDLARGVAEHKWPFPEGTETIITALAKHPSGKLAMTLHEGAVVIASPEGGMTKIGEVPETGPVAGLHWVGDALEVVPGRRTEIEVFTWTAGTWARAPLPVPGDDARLELVEVADGKRVLHYRLRAREPVGPDIELMSGDGAITRVQLGGRGTPVLDRASGNVVQWTPASPQMIVERTASGFAPFVPLEPTGPITGDYIVEVGRLVWLPRWGDWHRIGGEWIQTAGTLFPARGGGVWQLGDDHTYAHIPAK